MKAGHPDINFPCTHCQSTDTKSTYLLYPEDERINQEMHCNTCQRNFTITTYCDWKAKEE
jgi:hypothetical protein